MNTDHLKNGNGTIPMTLAIAGFIAFCVWICFLWP